MQKKVGIYDLYSVFGY